MEIWKEKKAPEIWTKYFPVEAELVDDADLLLDEDEHVRNESEE